jgi:MFS family permease
MLRYRPFQRLLVEVVAWALAYGGVQAFCVAFLRTGVGLPEGQILLVSSVSFLGGLSSLWFLGGRLDTLGSKPVLTFCIAAAIAVMAGWMALAGGVWPVGWGVVGLLQFLIGLLAALVSMSNTRLAMAIIPTMGRTHFFALYSVFSNVALGISPILWGLLLDAVGQNQWAAWGLTWTRYSIFFAAVAVSMGATLLTTRRLEEPTARSMEALLREILVDSPQRILVRFWPRG